jgi:hypothetical protein
MSITEQVTTIITTIRPDVSIPFFKNTDELIEYVKYVHVDSGNIVSSVVTLSDDNLTRTETIVWANQEALDFFAKDQMILDSKKLRKEYNKQNGIYVYM